MPLPLDEGAEQTAQELRELREFFEHAPCGLASADSHGVLVQVNQTRLDWLGYSRDEILGKVRILDLAAPHLASVVAESFALFQRQGYVRNIEHALLRRDGTVLPVLLSATMIRDAEGRF